MYVREQGIRIAQGDIAPIFQINLDDMVFSYALFLQVRYKEIEQQIRFARPSKPGNNLYQSIVLAINELIQVMRSFHYHAIPKN